ncbi:MAG TPA: pitrilysin family protein [Longimicrobium sp.]|jgi:predicted Zn-dependent peptidase|uniref:M16 family metallopeptidase n=1 Tax=Longimicrobium sp. TaxID=2029185 RepID=UPI002ED8BB7B
MKQTLIRLAAPALLAGVLPAVAAAQASPPPPMEQRPVRFPTFTESELPNGLRILVVENHALPVANLNLYVRSGSSSDPEDKLGVAAMTAGLLDKGTTTRTAVQIADTVEGVGGSIVADVDQDNLTASVNVLSDQLPLAFELLSDVVLRPTFPAEELETVRGQQLAALRAALGSPATLASRTFERQAFGTAHPYGRRSVPATVSAITRDDVAAFHRAHFVPRNAMLVVSGDVTPAQAREMAGRFFGQWSGGAAPADAYPAPPARERAEIYLVHRPGSVQSSLFVGHPGLTPDNPDYYAVQVMNMVLGLSGDSRLEMVLRGQHGWTYGARSRFSRLLGGGAFSASTDVRVAVTDSALSELMVQLRRIRAEPVPQEELDRAKSYLVASFPGTVETPAQAASSLAATRLLGLPAEHLTQYPQRVAAVTAADVRRVAGQYLQPDHAVLVVVGDATQVLGRLRPIAPVTVFDVEGRPVDPATLQPAGGG